MRDKYNIKFSKVRNVNSPSRSFKAAGIDFYIPIDLHIQDFTKNDDIYNNEYIIPKDPLKVSTTTFIVGDGNLYIEIQFLRTDNGIQYKLGKSNNGYPFNSNDEIISWIESPSTFITGMIIAPGGKVLIPSGIHVNLPEGVFLKAENKSGIASKRGLIFGASVVDEDYQGEVHICLINPTSDVVKVKAGDKIIQFLPEFSPLIENLVEEKSVEDLYKNQVSERGADGFGSTDNKKETVTKNTSRKTKNEVKNV